MTVRISARLRVGVRFFSEDLLQDDLVPRQICHELLELAILFVELTKPPDLGHGHLTVAFTPDIVRDFADPELTWTVLGAAGFKDTELGV